MAMSLTIFSTSRRLAGKTEINKDNNKDDNNIVVNNKHERKEENKNVSNQDKQTIPNTSTNTHAQANKYRTLSHHQTMRSFPEAGYSGGRNTGRFVSVSPNPAPSTADLRAK